MSTALNTQTARTGRRFGAAHWSRWSAIAAIGIVVALFSVALPRLIPIVGWSEIWLRDFRTSRLGPVSEPRTDIAVLGIDELTLDRLPYRSPIDRRFLADILKFLAHEHVRGVVIDILFDKATEPDKDAALRDVLQHFPVPLFVAWGDVGDTITDQQHAFMLSYLDGVKRGYANLIRDDIDSGVRKLNVHHLSGQEAYPGLAAAMAAALKVPLPAENIPIDYLRGPDADSPAIPVYPAFLAAPGPDGSAPAMPPAFVAGKIVLIGANLQGIDRFVTPFGAGFGVRGAELPGVVVHAQSLAQLIDGRRLHETGLPTELGLVAFAVALGLLLALWDISLWARLSGAVIGLTAIWIALLLVYRDLSLLMPMVSPSIGFLVAVTATSFYQQRRFLQERTFIRSALSRYVAEDVVKELEADPSRLKLGGQRRELTYLFTDIAGFTTLSEKTEPAVLVAALNAYLDGATRVVLEHGGGIDKYIGDAVVAYFGAFSDDGKHPSHAVACAIALDAFASQFAAEQRANGLDFGITRIGVNSGSAIIGNFGGEDRFDYTAIGDMVNTAARLEGANKYLGTRVCVAASAAARCPEITFRPAAKLIVKGRHEGIDVLEPLGPSHPALAYRGDYVAAYAMLERGDPGAAAAFERLQAQAPGDLLVKLHAHRLASGHTGVTIELEGK